MNNKAKIFFEKANKIHEEFYDYSESKYIKTHEKIKIICPEHGEFWQKPVHHIRKGNPCGCPECGKIRIGKKSKKRIEERGHYGETIHDKIIKAKKIHKNKYDYSEVRYIDSLTKVKIKCPEHGFFEQLIKYHIQKKSPHGCPKCGKIIKNKILTMDSKKFIIKAREIHGNKYDYSKVNYINNKTKVTIICPEHGEFEQKPNHHIRDSDPCGCPECFSSISKGEKEILNFIRKTVPKLEVICNSRIILGDNKELDIFIPELNLAIEYNGCYWHSSKFKNKNYHLEKTKECDKLSIQLIHIFEDEWKYKKNIVKRRLLHLLGKSEKIFARNCKIIEIEDSKIRNDFLNKYHIQGGDKSSVSLGLEYNEEIVSIMTFCNSRFDGGNNTELSRFTSNKSVIGGASRLLKYFIKNYDYNGYIITYADRRWSKGKLYEVLGFKFSHFTYPSYSYVNPNNCKRESRIKYQKHKLYRILDKFDENFTEKENMINNNFYQLYDCGNYVFKFY